MCGADKTHGSAPRIDMSSGTVGETAGSASLINVSVTLGRWHAAFPGRAEESVACSLRQVPRIGVNAQLLATGLFYGKKNPNKNKKTSDVRAQSSVGKRSSHFVVAARTYTHKTLAIRGCISCC